MPTREYTGILSPGRGITVATPPLALAQTGNKTMFTLYGGPCHVNAIWGVVTTAIQNQACTLQLAVKIGALTAVTITGSATSVANLTVGTAILPITSFATSLSTAANGVFINMPGASGSLIQFDIGQISGSGNSAIIYHATSASNTGQIQWYLNYTPYGNSTPTIPTQANYPCAEVVAASS